MTEDAPSRSRRSPIERTPRRQAGQALRARLANERDAFLMYAGGVAVSGVLAIAITWVMWVVARPWTPWVLTIGMVVGVGILTLDGARRVRRSVRDQLGLEGELTTAEWLNDLTASGYYVFHDLPSERGNIDHVAVGPAGVFVIETKTRKKAPGAKVRYDGKTLRIGNWDATIEFLGQARACRDEVKRRLQQADDARGIPVRAILAIPGWDVEEHDASGAEVWVLNPKRRIAAWVAMELRLNGKIGPGQLAAAKLVLDRWARTTESDRRSGDLI